MKKLIPFLSLLFIALGASAQTFTATWFPSIQTTMNYASLPNGMENTSVTAVYDLYQTTTDTILHYSFFICPKRFTPDSSVEGILNHYGSCGTFLTYQPSGGVSNMTNVYTFDSYSTLGALQPGESYYATIVVSGNHTFVFSKVFTFKTAGTSHLNLCLVAGCDERCSNTPAITATNMKTLFPTSAPTPVVTYVPPPTPKHGNGKGSTPKK